MTPESKKVSGSILLSVPTIIYGGYFLLTVLSGEQDNLHLSEFQKSMFRAGHAHAGVLVIFALLIQLFVDNITASNAVKWFIRIVFPVSAILISLGFFAAAIGKDVSKPTDLIFILYVGIVCFVAGLVTLGLGLLRK